MTRNVLGCAVAVFGSVAFGGEARLCIAPVEFPALNIKLGAEDKGEPREFDIRIDDLPRVTTSHTKSQRIEGLDSTKKHLVAIRRNKQPSSSFYFTFDEFDGDEPCLFFEPFYGYWRLWKRKDAPWCKCPPVEAK